MTEGFRCPLCSSIIDLEKAKGVLLKHSLHMILRDMASLGYRNWALKDQTELIEALSRISKLSPRALDKIIATIEVMSPSDRKKFIQKLCEKEDVERN